jgi:ribosomal protein L19
MKTTDLVDNQSLRDDIPEFFPGDELKVHVRVVEGGKERVQVFQGNVIRARAAACRRPTRSASSATASASSAPSRCTLRRSRRSRS